MGPAPECNLDGPASVDGAVDDRDDVPHIADIAVSAVEVPTGSVAPAERQRREIVRADEFATNTRRVGDDPSASRAGANGGKPFSIVDARREAERAVRAFASALNAQDVDALRRAAPDMPASARAQWAKVFHEASGVRAELTVFDVQVDGDVIAARVHKRIDVHHAGIATPVRSAGSSLATLVRDSTGWRLSTTP